MMEVVLGKIPPRLLKKAKNSDSFFINGKLNYPNANTDSKSRRFVKKMKSLEVIFYCVIYNLLKNILNPQNVLMHSFVDLIRLMLKYDTKERITAKDALKHEFFNKF